MSNSKEYRVYKATGKTSLGFAALALAARSDAEAMEIAGASMVRVDALAEVVKGAPGDRGRAP